MYHMKGCNPNAPHTPAARGLGGFGQRIALLRCQVQNDILIEVPQAIVKERLVEAPCRTRIFEMIAELSS